MRFKNSDPIGGSLDSGFIDEWIWPRPWNDTRTRGGYESGRYFFHIHWGVQRRDPNSIRLYIGSPRHSDDAFLNDLKRDVINAIFASDVAETVGRNGYEYQKGKKLSSADSNKTTELFRVILTDKQHKPTVNDDMIMVDKAVHSQIDQVVQRFVTQLNHHFV